MAKLDTKTGLSMRLVLIFVGVTETMTGVLLFIAPGVVSELLFGTNVIGPSAMFSQLAGIALIGLGTACWPGPAALGMLIYGSFVGLYLAWVGISQVTSGPLLWPAAILHAILVVPLLICIKAGRPSDAAEGPQVRGR